MLLASLSTSLLENILTGKGAIATSQGRVVNRAGERTVRAGYGNKKFKKQQKTKRILNVASSFN